MTVKEISDFIRRKKYSFIDIVIPNINFNYYPTSVQSIVQSNGSLENYFEKIFKNNRVTEYIVKVFVKNGKKPLCKNEYPVFWQKTEPIDEPVSHQENISNSSVIHQDTINNQSVNHQSNINPTSENYQYALHGLPETPTETTNKPKTNSMDTKDYIDFRVLQTEHKNLTQRYEDTKGKVVKLEKKIEELHDENKQLLRDNATKEDKHSLALERAKLDMEREGKEGLSGILGELQENPMLVEALVGFINPKHPMFEKNKEQKMLSGAEDETREIKYTEDAQANIVLNDIPRKLSQTNGDTISKIYLLFQEFLSKPDVLHTVANTYFPNIFK